jgi:hypothetical protein
MNPARSEGSTPRFSIILPAYSRRAFLVGAVRSVLSQRGDPAECEVIVVKNFLDAEVDGFLESEGVQVLDSGSGTYGVMIAMAVRACRGEVVAILEDDDLFDAGKMARLREVFNGSLSVSFYHNDYREIDELGAAKSPSGQRQEIDRRVGSRGVEIFAEEDKLGAFDRMGDSVAEAHVSCLALPRSTLLRVLPFLEPVNIGGDFFLFFVGLASEGAVVIDPSKLTLYRRHPANSSRALDSDPGSYQELVEGSRVMGRETRKMLRSLDGARFQPLLEQELSAHRVYIAITAPLPRRPTVARALIGMLRHPRSFRGVGRPQLFGRGCAFLIAPKRALQLLR